MAALSAAAVLLAPTLIFAGTTPRKAAPLPPVQAPVSSAKQQGPAVIPLADVATQGTIVGDYLDTLIQQSAVSSEVQAIQKQFGTLLSLIHISEPTRPY